MFCTIVQIACLLIYLHSVFDYALSYAKISTDDLTLSAQRARLRAL